MNGGADKTWSVLTDEGQEEGGPTWYPAEDTFFSRMRRCEIR